MEGLQGLQPWDGRHPITVAGGVLVMLSTLPGETSVLAGLRQRLLDWPKQGNQCVVISLHLSEKNESQFETQQLMMCAQAVKQP